MTCGPASGTWTRRSRTAVIDFPIICDEDWSFPGRRRGAYRLENAGPVPRFGCPTDRGRGFSPPRPRTAAPTLSPSLASRVIDFFALTDENNLFSPAVEPL